MAAVPETPIIDPSIIKSKRAVITEKVMFENVWPIIRPLIERHGKRVNDQSNNREKIREILDFLERLIPGKQFGAFNAFFKALGQVVLAKLTELVYCFFAIFRNVIEPLVNGKMSIHSLKVSVCWDKKKPLERGFFN